MCGTNGIRKLAQRIALNEVLNICATTSNISQVENRVMDMINALASTEPTSCPHLPFGPIECPDCRNARASEGI